MPPPILGPGNGAVWTLRRRPGGTGLRGATNAVGGLREPSCSTPGMGYPISGYQANVPQLDAEVDPRQEPRHVGIALTDLFAAMQIYLGSAYVNDFNLFGRTWRVCGRTAIFAERSKHFAGLQTRKCLRRDGS